MFLAIKLTFVFPTRFAISYHRAIVNCFPETNLQLELIYGSTISTISQALRKGCSVIAIPFLALKKYLSFF